MSQEPLFTAVIEPLYVEGGCGYPLQTNTFYMFMFADVGIGIWTPQAMQASPAGPQECIILYQTVASIEIGGQGVITTDGGFIGGGFGLGALLGMAVASFANAATTNTQVDTTLALTTAEGELMLRSTTLTPEQLRLRLSPVFVLLQELCAEAQRAAAAPPHGEGVDVAEELRKLAELKAQGLITAAEFKEAKAKLLR
jgi:hypothetical protein